MAAFATATSPRTEYAVVRALSTSDALHRRAPTTEATAPYAASERAMASETVPTNAATSADHGRGWRFARGGWSVLLAVLDQHGVRVKRTVGAERALQDDADAGSEQRGGAASMDDGHPGRSVGDDEVDAVTVLVNRARDDLAAETKPLARGRPLLQQLGRCHVVDEVARERARSDPRQAPGDQDEQDNDPSAHASDSIAGFADPSRQRGARTTASATSLRRRSDDDANGARSAVSLGLVLPPRRGEPHDTVAHRIGVENERQADPIRELPVDGRHGARDDRHTVSRRGERERRRVSNGDPNPQAQPAAWRIPRPPWQPLPEQPFEHGLPFADGFSPPFTDGVEIVHQVERDDLAHRRRPVIGHELHASQSLNDRGWRSDPSDAETAPEELRQRADRQHGNVALERADRRRRLIAEGEVGDGEVLDDRELELVRRGRDLDPLACRHERPGRVVVRRHQVCEAGRARERRVAKSVGANALDTDRNGEQPKPGGREHVDRREVRGVLDERHVTGARVQRRGEPHRLLRTRRDDDLVHRRGHRPPPSEVIGDRGAERCVPDRLVADPVASGPVEVLERPSHGRTRKQVAGGQRGTGELDPFAGPLDQGAERRGGAPDEPLTVLTEPNDG